MEPVAALGVEHLLDVVGAPSVIDLAEPGRFSVNGCPALRTFVQYTFFGNIVL